MTNLNPTSDIGANAWLLELDGRRVLIDPGLHPKLEGKAALPQYDLIDSAAPLDAIAVSHCHLDHVGSLPVAMRLFPDSQAYMTDLSYFIVERALHNAVNVMKRKADESKDSDYPLYRHQEVEEMAASLQAYKCNREFEWGVRQGRSARGVAPTMEFFDAGHVLGSAGIMIRGESESVFYTGDVSFQDQTILKGADFDDVRADVLVLETTRGSRDTSKSPLRSEETERLRDSIVEVLERGGSVLIPSFALGRTQEVLANVSLLFREGRLPRQPIYIGGLGRVYTEIYDLQAHRARRHLTSLRLTEELNLTVLSRPELEQIRLKSGRIFVITAGMMSEHTGAHELASRMAEDKRHAIFFVGYADPETPGGRMKASFAGAPFLFSDSVGELTRSCELREFDLTGHANREELIDFIERVDPRVVVLTHGEDEAKDWFAEAIRARYPRIQVVVPKPGECVEV